MKILAIRGKNLASLAGSFEVDLEAGALGESGVYAITGPTGAGKSTILDAMCLALFDQTPRLRGRGRTVGFVMEHDQEELSSADPRCLLRRGASEATAEVDFLGKDGQRWRATWSVRRARRRPNGRIQKQSLTLLNLDTGLEQGGTKTRTLAAIEAALGLDYSGFCRSVLLAQNEFASFLRAGPTEKAELLERMTGTSLYGALSVAAHRRAGEERSRLERLLAEQGALVPLEAEARAALETERAATDVRLTALRAARAAVEEAARAEAAAQASLASVTRLEGEAERATAAARATDAAVSEARTGLEAAVAGREALAPALARARTLEAEEEVVGERVAELAAAAAGAGDQARVAREQVARERGELARLAAERTAAQEWLTEHAHHAPLAGQWPRWRALLERAVKLSDELYALEAARESVMAGKARAKAASAEVDAAVADWRRKQGEAEDALFELRGAPRTRSLFGEVDDPDEDDGGIGRTLRELEVERLRLVELRALLRRCVDTHDARERALAAGLEAAEAGQGASERARAASTEAVRLGSALEEAAKTLSRLRATLGLAEQRHELVAGDPCPLCGATEHPYARELPPLASEAHAQEARVRELGRGLREVQREEARARAEEEAARTEAEAAEERVAASAAALEEASATWAAQAGPGLSRHEPWTEQAGHALEAAWADSEERLRIVREREARLGRARRTLEQVRQACGEARERQFAARARAQEKAHAAREVERELAERGAQRDAVRVEVAAAFPDVAWQAELDQAPAELLARCERDQAAWREQKATLERVEAARASLEPKAEASAARATELETTAAAAAEAETAAAARRDELVRQRAALFASPHTGRRAAEVEQHLADAVRAAEARLRAAQDAQDASRSLAAAARAQLEVNREQHGRDVAARDERRVALGAALEAVELDDPARVVAAETAVARRAVEVAGRLESDDAIRTRAAELEPAIEAQRAAFALWDQLNQLIGSHDGKKFRVFAQSLTLEVLLDHANRFLRELAPRYRLERVRGEDLDLQVVDRDLGDEVRAVSSLSGGEGFLVSLALALGLSALSSRETRIESLFVDEGFGSLDLQSQEIALSTLDALQASGRQVGLISHVPGLAQRIGVGVRVQPLGQGKSTVKVA